MSLIAFKPIFSTPFGYANFGEYGRELNKQLIKDIDQHMLENMSRDRTFAKNESAWQSDHFMEDHYDSFRQLGVLIEEASKPILKHSGLKDDYLPHVKVEHLWSNVIFDVGGYSRPHHHGSGRTIWSGVYYPKGMEEDDNLDKFEETDYIKLGFQKGDGLLVCFDPAKVTKGLIKTGMDTGEFWGQDITVVPRESLLVLFPVWVPHMVTPLTKKQKRYSISFAINCKYAE